MEKVINMNCAGFALNINQRLHFNNIFNNFIYNKLWNEAHQITDRYDVANRIIANNMGKLLCDYVCNTYGYKQIVTNAFDAPIGCLAIRVGSNALCTDFHFARKELFDDETAWLHKPGKLPVDIMLNENIMEESWSNLYDSETFFIVKA